MSFDIKDRETGPFALACTVEVGDSCVHRFQEVRDSMGEPHVVVGFTENGVMLQDIDFAFPSFEVTDLEDYEVKTSVHGEPVFAY